MRTLNIMAVLTLLVGCTTPIQSELDAEVRRLCAVDGGVTVYEKVELAPEKFDKNGKVHVPAKDKAGPNDEYYFEWDMHYYRKGEYEDAAMWRSEQRIVRKLDQKVLGKSIQYARRGGDIPGPWHPSSFTCPGIAKDRPGLESSVFQKGNAR